MRGLKNFLKKFRLFCIGGALNEMVEKFSKKNFRLFCIGGALNERVEKFSKKKFQVVLYWGCLQLALGWVEKFSKKNLGCYLCCMKKVIKVNESELRALICETVRHVLNENASQILYHYIDVDNLITLLHNNRMKTARPEIYFSDGTGKYIDGENQNFISFTRNRNAKEGYPVLKYGPYGVDDGYSLMCRLEIDGDYFNTHNMKRKDKRFKNGYEKVQAKVRPMDWAYWDTAEGGQPDKMADNTNGVFASNGKEWQMKSDSFDYYLPIDNDATDIYNHPMSQAEDRLTSTSKYIPNASEYIKAIDVLLLKDFNENDYKVLKKIDAYAKKLGIEVNLYDNIDYFNKQYSDESFDIYGALELLSRNRHTSF